MNMNRTRLLLLSAVALAASAPVMASTCSQGIILAVADIDTRLHEPGPADHSAVEGTAARLHHQPTPKSLTAAEVKLGEINPQSAAIVGAAMARARTAEAAGNGRACAQALADLQRELDR